MISQTPSVFSIFLWPLRSNGTFYIFMAVGLSNVLFTLLLIIKFKVQKLGGQRLSLIIVSFDINGHF